jgi:hypothetical protein
VALGERDPDALDFYVGPPDLAAAVRRSPPRLDQIAAEALSLEQSLDAVQSPRADFLRRQLRAIRYRVGMLQGRKGSFDDESLALFGIQVQPDENERLRGRTRAQIAALIGPGARAYTAFDARFVVPPDRVNDVLQAALAACRTATLGHMALPPGEQVRVEYVAHKPWSAFSRYEGQAHSRIQVNVDYPLTVDRLLDLACHEGYPGHHVFNSVKDAGVADKLPEWKAQPTFSPQSYTSEAAASYAPEMAFPGAERVRVERDVLFPLAGFKPGSAEKYLHVSQLVASLHTAEPAIAREYLDGSLEFVRAADALEREALMEHAETPLIYLNEYRTYMLCYTQGRDAVGRWVEGGDRWQRYHALMLQPR